MTASVGFLYILLGLGAAESGVIQDHAAAKVSSSVIAVIVPDKASASVMDALTRLRGEAEAVGFEIRLVENAQEIEPLPRMERVAREIEPAAVVALSSPPSAEPAVARAMDVWFFDRTSGKTSYRRLTVEEGAGERAEQVLAVRMLDFIRARMFDSLVRVLAANRQSRHTHTSHATVGRIYLAAGGGATGSYSGLPAAYLPAVALGYLAKSWLRVGLGGSLFGGEPRLETSAGSATLTEALAKVGASVLGPTWWRVRPVVEVDAVAYHLSVHGVGYSGFVGHDGSTWSFGALLAPGIDAVLASRLVFHADYGLLFLIKEPKVFIDEVQVARTGRPAWLATASLGVTF